MAPDMRRMVVIINPATRGNVSRIIELMRLNAPAGTEVDIHVTERAGHAHALAAEHAVGADVLVAVGGDGTVGEVASAARASGVPIGIIPGGSTNIVAKDLGIPTNSHQAIRLLFGDHTVRVIDAGICGEQVFLHMAGAGVDSHLFDLANPDTKRKVGWMAYIPAAARALVKPLSTFTIRSEERTLVGVKSPMVLVANGSSIIVPQIRLDSRIRYDDGLLDVLVVTATNPAELARVLADIGRRRLIDSPHVQWFQTRDVEIDANPEIAVQLDGDVAHHTPVRFTVAPSAVSVIVPPT